jgi:hypothetical protein
MANQITIDILANTRNLVSGVNNVNGQLQNLNNTATRVTGVFRGLLGTLGLTIGVNALTNWVKDAAAEEAEFKRLAANYGKDADAITASINNLSQEFKIDDGAIASYFNTLSGKVQVGNNKVLEGIVESSLKASAKFGQPAESYVNAWIKVLKDGKIKASEVGVLGAAIRDKDAQKAFDALDTTGEKIAFLQERITGGVDTATLIGPWQELTYELDQLNEAVGEELLGPHQTLLDIIFPENEEGERSLAEWVNDLAIALGLLWSVGKIAAAVEFIRELKKTIGKIAVTVGMTKFGSWIVTTTAGATTLTEAAGLLWAALSPTKKVLLIGATLAAIFALLPEEVQQDIKDAVKKIKDFFVKEFNESEWGKEVNKIYKDFKKAWNEADWAELGKIAVTAALTWFIPKVVRDKFTETYDALKKEWEKKDWKGLGTVVITGIVKGLVPKPVEDAITTVGRFMKAAWDKITRSKSPSRVFMESGKDIVEGLAIGIEKSKALAQEAIGVISDTISSPFTTSDFAYAGGRSGKAVNNYVTINAGVGTDPYELGRVVKAALDKYTGVNGR